MDNLTSKELKEIKAIETWINIPRFTNIIREYTSYDIWKMRSKYNNSYISNEMSKKLYNIFIIDFIVLLNEVFIYILAVGSSCEFY